VKQDPELMLKLADKKRVVLCSFLFSDFLFVSFVPFFVLFVFALLTFICVHLRSSAVKHVFLTAHAETASAAGVAAR